MRLGARTVVVIALTLQSCRSHVVSPPSVLSGPDVDLYLELDGGLASPVARPSEAPLVRREPVRIVPGSDRDDVAIMCHPPGKVVFRVELGASPRFVATFHRPRALVRSGSDGVELVVTAEADGRERIERRQYLAPSDPDTVPLSLDLAPLSGMVATLTLATGPGPRNDYRYDGAYFVAPRVVQHVPLATPAAPPLALLVTIDTLRQDRLACNGDPTTLTPALDRLARSGRLWARAYAQCNATTPSHAVLLSGRAPGEIGVYGSDTPLPASFETLPERFRAKGARTAAVVSVAHLKPEMSGLGRGFEEFVGTAVTREAKATTDLALGILSHHRADPLFFWVHYFDPHTSYDPPETWRRYYEMGVAPALAGTPIPERIRSEADAVFPDSCRRWLSTVSDPALPDAWYSGEVSHVSEEIARLLAAVRAWGRAGSATIVLTADHGESLNEHGVYYGHAALFDPEIAVPMIVARPGLPPGIEPGPAAHVDVFPTLAGAPPAGGSGVRLGEEATPADRPLVAIHAHRESISLRRGDLKVILPVDPFFAVNRERHRLDLAADPEEQREAAGNDAAFADLDRRAAAAAAACAAPSPIPVSEEERAKLEALGYLH